jgi:hypothetical protein
VIGGTRGAAAQRGLRRTTLVSRMHTLGISRQPLRFSNDCPALEGTGYSEHQEELPATRARHATA